jgi:hypothetical protein
MKELSILALCGWSMVTVAMDLPALSQALPQASAASQSVVAYPSQAERDEERARLSQQRQQLENQYKLDMKQCYQKFDVTSCRLKARDRRIDANAVLREQELRFNRLERHIQVDDSRRSLAERNSEAEQKRTEAERVAAITAAKKRADDNAQKQIDHALQGTKRGDYEQKQREAAQHRADVEKKNRKRNKEPAAPLPLPSK